MPENNYSGSLLYADNPILKQTFEFSITIIKYAEQLEENKKYVIARQIIRSGTSIGANAKEAQMQKAKQILSTK